MSAAAFVGTGGMASASQGIADWDAWKAVSLTADGRVIDDVQDAASHSEGQGYGMILAEWFGDHESFRRMHDWTEKFLAVRRDPLLAWRWQPGAVDQIEDYNNASDGDLFYAWALARGATRFQTPAYLDRARDIARFLAVSCLRDDPRIASSNASRPLLLMPAAEGFEGDGNYTINPSYYMPLALRELGTLTDTPALNQCADDGLTLIAELAAAGPVPDWIMIGPDGWQMSPGHPPHSGYEAIRVALYLIWSGHADHMAAQRGVTGTAERVATVRHVKSFETVETSDLPGYRSVAALVACANGTGESLPVFTASQPYYPAILQLFTGIAAEVSGLNCGGE